MARRKNVFRGNIVNEKQKHYSYHFKGDAIESLAIKLVKVKNDDSKVSVNAYLNKCILMNSYYTALKGEKVHIFQNWIIINSLNNLQQLVSNLHYNSAAILTTCQGTTKHQKKK